MAGVVLHCRAEQKPLEYRSCITPATASSLLAAGYTVHVERSPTGPAYRRIFTDDEFTAVGATLVPTNSWPTAPSSHIIIGLKELPEQPAFPLTHQHVQFAHCFKGQKGWAEVLARFARGRGLLYDLEFLHVGGRRVAGFGFHAGFAGAGLAVKTWAWQLEHGDAVAFPSVHAFTDGKGYYDNEAHFLAQLRADLHKAVLLCGRPPRVLVAGALGRAGRGAVDLFRRVGVPDENVVKWDIAETSAKPGPYREIVESDIFVNCIYLSAKIPPFVDLESLKCPERNLSVICDVSADTANPNNPIPLYSEGTTFTDPTVAVEGLEGRKLSVIGIDHLPSLLPRESSEAYSADLLPYLLQLKDRETAEVWVQAEKLFKEKVATLPKELLEN